MPQIFIIGIYVILCWEFDLLDGLEDEPKLETSQAQRPKLLHPFSMPSLTFRLLYSGVLKV